MLYTREQLVVSEVRDEYQPNNKLLDVFAMSLYPLRSARSA
jgi:hypothetical protein